MYVQKYKDLKYESKNELNKAEIVRIVMSDVLQRDNYILF